MRIRIVLIVLLFTVVATLGGAAAENGRPRGSTDILTVQEHQYLNTKGEVTFCVDPDWMPFEAIRNGRLDGMTSDLQNVFAERLGIPFRLVPTETWAQSLDHVKAGVCDILPLVPITQERLEYLTFTDPYLSYSVGIIAANTLPFISGLADLSHKPVGIVTGYSTWEYVRKNFPNNTFVEVDGIEDGLLKVSSGEISAFLIAVPVAVQNIKDLGLSNLKVAGYIQVKKELRIGISRKAGPLAPIINKMTASLRNEDIDGVYHKWVRISADNSQDYTLIVSIALGLFVILTVLAWWNRKLARLNKEITEREGELQAAKDQAEQYLRIAGTVIVALDSDARVQLINRAGAQLIGMPAREIRGLHWIDNFIPEEQRPSVRKTFNLIMSGVVEPVESFENEIVDVHGNVHLISWHNTLVTNADEQIVGTLSSGDDITKAREAETKLLAAKIEAEQANRAKTKFLAAASHDLRQPAQAMNLFIHALRQAEDDPTKLDMLAQLEESSHNLSSLLTSLLDISRLDAGAVKVDKKTISVSQLFSTLLDEYEKVGQENQIQFDCVPCAVNVDTDPTLMGIILRNLISNAMTHAGTKRVLLGCRRRANGFVELQVWDSGIGIPEDDLDQIFTEFYQVHNEARRREMGLGLGLAIVKRMSELLGHELEVRSEPGRGTMFSIRVPTAGQSEATPPRINGDLHSSGISGRTIVVVEDEAQVRHALMLVLEDANNVTVGFADMESAESLAQINTLGLIPDIIIADYRLGNGHTGVEAIHKIRKLMKAEIPAFLLTGDTAPERIQEALQSGFPLLHKPVHPQDLFDQINRSLKT